MFPMHFFTEKHLHFLHAKSMMPELMSWPLHSGWYYIPHGYRAKGADERSNVFPASEPHYTPHGKFGIRNLALRK